MKVEIRGYDLMIVPETDFEVGFLRLFKRGKVFHKTGMSASDYLGIKIVASQPNDSADFKCPNCGSPWDTKKNNACQCGAVLSR